MLVELAVGDNAIELDFLGVRERLEVSYSPRDTEHLVRLVYVVCGQQGGGFQRPGGEGSLEEGVNRLRVAGMVLQGAMAETMHEEGMGRQTFQLARGGGGEVEVAVHRTRLSVEQVGGRTAGRGNRWK